MRIVIVKSGSSFKLIRDKYGDFDQLISKRLENKATQITTITIQNQPVLPDTATIDAVIITGAHENVTDQTAWMLYLMNWIKVLKKQSIPVLGICFGHQIIAEALGGRVGFHPLGGEYGLIEVEVRNVWNTFLKPFSNQKIVTYASHNQTILELPPNAVSLGYNAHDSNHIVKFSTCMWGLQFHPEFTASVAREYWRRNNPEGCCANNQQNKLANAFGTEILRLFVEFAKSKCNPH